MPPQAGWALKFQGTMNPERTITITHKNADGELEQTEVRMLYCAASETGFQSLSGEVIDVFNPEIEKDEKGDIVIKSAPKATDMHYIQLAIACIVAAYESDGKEPPITSEDIMYHATREEVVKLVQAVVEMRTEWLFVPSTISNETKPAADGGKRKNGQTPTKPSKRS